MTRIAGSLRDLCLARHRVRFIVGRSSWMEGITRSLGDLCLARYRVRLIVNVLFVAAWTPCTGSNSEDRNGNSERLEHLLKKM